MAQKRHEPGEFVAKLRQVDVLVSPGRTGAEAVPSISGTPFTHHRWRKEFDGRKADQVKRLKAIEEETERLRKAVSDLTPEEFILGVRLIGRTPRATIETRPPPSLSRARRTHDPGLGASRVPGSQPASLDPSRKVPRGRADEDALTADIVALASQHGRCGCRRVTGLLRDAR